MPAYEHEVELARREGVRVRFSRARSRSSATRTSRASRCAEMRLGAPRRERPPPARAGSGSDFVVPVDTVVKAIGQRPRDEFRALTRVRRPRTAARPTRSSLPPATRSTAARASSRRSREAKRAVARDRRGAAMRRADRDPLARARRPGREDGRPDPRAGAAAGRQGRAGVPRVRPRAARRAAARVHPRSPTARSAATTRSPTRTSSSSSSRRSSTRPASPRGSPPDGVVLFNGDEPPASSTGSTSAASRRRGSPRQLGSGFVNVVMLGAVAAALGEPPLEELQDAAVETLGRKVAADDIRRALAEGYAWLS